jgi:Ribosomal protein S6
MGHYFIVQFDSSSPVMQSVRRTLELDPRMIRHSVVKIGDKLRDAKGDTAKHGAMAEKDGKVAWNVEPEGDIDTEMLVSRQGRFGARPPGREASASDVD